MLGREEVSYSEKPGGSNTYKEADNCGTRQDTVDAATAYWMARTQLKKKEPFILYSFASESDACASLLELPCIQVAADTGNMICTEVLTFGCYYSSQTSRYEAALCGQELTHELWSNRSCEYFSYRLVAESLSVVIFGGLGPVWPVCAAVVVFSGDTFLS